MSSIVEINNTKEPSKSLFKTYIDPSQILLKKKQNKEEKEKSDSSNRTKIHGIIFKKSNPDIITKKNSCNCKNSQCLKLYCQCFSKFDFCDPEFCSCKGCANTKENEVIFFLFFTNFNLLGIPQRIIELIFPEKS